MGVALIRIRDFEHAGIVGCLSEGGDSGVGNPDATGRRWTLRAYSIEGHTHGSEVGRGGEGKALFYPQGVRDHSIHHTHESSTTLGFLRICLLGDIDLTSQIQYDHLLGGGTSASPAGGNIIVPIFSRDSDLEGN